MNTVRFYLALLTLLSSVALAQTADSGSAFSNYCYDRCFALAQDSRCEKLCLTDDAGFQLFCAETCVDRGLSGAPCTLACNILGKKRSEMKGCFDPCAATGSNESCDSSCNITSSVNSLVTAAGMAVKGDLTEERLAIIERHIGDVFPNSTVARALGREIIVNEGKMNLTEVDGKKYIRLPLGLENNEKLDSLEDRLNNITIINDTVYIPLHTRIGTTISTIVAKTDGIRGKDGIGEGEVKEISLETEAVKADFKATVDDELKGRLKQPEVTIDADLTGIPMDAAVGVQSSDVPDTKLERFKEIAKAKGLEIKEKALAVEVIKSNLQNQKDITRAKVRMKVDKLWLDSVGGISGVRMMREDSGNYELLNTVSVGEENGMVIVEGDSPNGLSLYAMVTVGVTSTSGDTGRVVVQQGQGGGINPLFIGVILVIVVAVVYFFVLKKKA